MRLTWIVLGVYLLIGATMTMADVGSQLAAHYPLNADASDASGNGLHGTLSGAFGATDLRGLVDNAVAFDGVDDNVTVPSLGNWGSELTISFWVFANSSAAGSTQILIGSRQAGSGATLLNFYVSLTDSGLVRFFVASNGTGSDLSSLAAMDLERWVHVVVDWSNTTGNMRIFLDGQGAAIGPIGSTPRYRSDSIGFGNFCDGCGSSTSFDGRMDEVRIYSRILDDAEIASLCTVAHYPFAADADAADASGRGNDGILYGPVLTGDRLGASGSAYSFDGTDDLIDVPSLRSWGSGLGFSLWAYLDPAGVGQSRVLIGSRGEGTGSTLLNVRLAVDASKTLSWTVASVSVHSSLTTVETVSPGRWVHLACDWSQSTGTMRIFMDGKLVASGGIGGTPRYLSASLGIGNYGAGYTSTRSPFFGHIDDVRIFNHALSDGELASLSSGLFADGFESADLSRWSSVVGLQ